MRRAARPYGFLLIAFLLSTCLLLAQYSNQPYLNANRGYTPVLFLDITAAEKKGTVVVEWTTSEEHGIKEYLVEKSMDGSRFYAVSTLPANTKLQVGSYSWTDTKLWGAIIYYRIKAIDEAGKFYISQVKIVSLSSKPVISIFPNPVVGNVVSININADKREYYQLRLFNAGGQLIMADGFLHTGGFVSYNIQLPLCSAGNGFYILKINGERGQSITQRLLVLK